MSKELLSKIRARRACMDPGSFEHSVYGMAADCIRLRRELEQLREGGSDLLTSYDSASDGDEIRMEIVADELRALLGDTEG